MYRTLNEWFDKTIEKPLVKYIKGVNMSSLKSKTSEQKKAVINANPNTKAYKALLSLASGGKISPNKLETTQNVSNIDNLSSYVDPEKTLTPGTLLDMVLDEFLTDIVSLQEEVLELKRVIKEQQTEIIEIKSMVKAFLEAIEEAVE